MSQTTKMKSVAITSNDGTGHKWTDTHVTRHDDGSLTVFIADGLIRHFPAKSFLWVDFEWDNKDG